VAGRRRLSNSLDLNFGVTEAIRAAGMEPGTQHAQHWLEPVSSGEGVRLGLEPGQDVLIVERVRTADGTAVVFSRDLLPGWVVGTQAGVGDAMLHHSIYDVLEKDLGIVIDHGVATFRPVRADRTVAQRLGIRRGELLLAIWQIDYDEEDRPVLSSHEYHIADAFDFSVVRRGPGRRFN